MEAAAASPTTSIWVDDRTMADPVLGAVRFRLKLQKPWALLEWQLSMGMVTDSCVTPGAKVSVPLSAVYGW